MEQMQLHDQQPVVRSNGPIPDSKRVPLERKVILKFHHFGGFFIEYSANISLTGMFIKSDSPKPPGSVFIFEIWLGDERRLVHGIGEVVWVRHEEGEAERPAGMGIRYIKIDAESQLVIKRVVAEQLNRGGEVFDLASENSGKPAAVDSETPERSGLTLVEPSNGAEDASDMLVLDEDLLGFEKVPATDPEVEEGDVVPPVAGSGRGLWVALLLVVLAVVLGGAAYLFSADLLPF